MAKPVLVVITKFSKKSGGLRDDLICLKFVWTVTSNAVQANVDFSKYVLMNEYRRYNTEIGQIFHINICI